MTPVFAGAFGYALGDRKYHVNDSAEAGRLLSSPADLQDAGFRWHHVCEPGTSAYDLARAAVGSVAERTALDPDVTLAHVP